MRERDVSGALLDGTETFDPAGPCRVGDVETEKARGRMYPVARLHHVGEQAHDPVGARGHRCRLALHDRINVVAFSLGLRLFQFAKGVAEPAHHDPAIKPEALHHP